MSEQTQEDQKKKQEEKEEQIRVLELHLKSLQEEKPDLERLHRDYSLVANALNWYLTQSATEEVRLRASLQQLKGKNV